MKNKKNKKNESKFKKIGQSVRKFFILAFQNNQAAFSRYGRKEKDPRGQGFWVYYDSYADFKRQQKRIKIIGWSTILLISAVVIVLTTMNIAFPAIFRTEASLRPVWQLNEASDFSRGEISGNAYIDKCTNELILLAGKARKDISARIDLDSWITPSKDSLQLAAVSGVSAGEITSNQGYAYTSDTDPALPNNQIANTWQDKNSGYLYVSTMSGLAVIDTRKTIEPKDDQNIAVYSLTSQPALKSNYVYHSWLDDDSGFLYVSTWAGLAVVDTKKTKKISDDELVFNYSSESQPRLPYSKVRHSFLDKTTGYLFVSIDGGGLNVIDTKGTKKFSDDVLLVTLDEKSDPSIDSDRVAQSFLDQSSGDLYVSTWGAGLSVLRGFLDNVRTKNRLKYDDKTEPSLPGNKVYQAYLDKKGQLYVGTSDGFIIIDKNNENERGGTAALYNKPGRNILPNSSVTSFWLDETSGYLYLAMNGGGVSVVDTGQSAVGDDDNLLFQYNLNSSPRLNDNNVNHILVDVSHNIIYASTEGGGLNVLTPGRYNQHSVLVSPPISMTDFSIHGIAWEERKLDGQKVIWRYRTADDGNIWEDDFDDNSTIMISDLWGGKFKNKTIADSKLTLSGREARSIGASFQLFDAKTNSFPAGSIIRLRMLVSTNDVGFDGVMFTDDWQGSGLDFRGINGWQQLTMIAGSAFTKIGLKLSWSEGGWTDDDFITIDKVSIESPDVNWSEWSAECQSDQYLPVTSDSKWIQLRADIEGDNVNIPPSVSSVSVVSGYFGSGEYYSPLINMDDQLLEDYLSADVSVPEQTGFDLLFRGKDDQSEDWSDWSNIKNGQILSEQFSFLQLKAILLTNNDNETPRLKSLIIEHNEEKGDY